MKTRAAERPDEHALLDAVGRIYAAALDPAAWEDALRTVGRLLGADSGLLQLTRLPSAQVAYVGFDIDPERARAYVDHFAAVDLYLPAAQAKARAGDVVWEYQIVPPNLLGGTEIFEDYLRPQGLFGARQSLGGMLQNDARALGFVQFVSRARRRSLAPRAQQTLELLLPHVRRAVQVQARLGEAQLAESTLDRLQVGVAILDSRGHVLRLNRAAGETLAERDGVELRREGLRVASRAGQAALERLIANTAAPRSGCEPGGTLAVPRPSGRRHLSLVAVAAPPAASLFSATLGTAVVVFIADPEAGPPATPGETLAVLYGLTPAEARTALLIADGCSPKEAARKLELSVDTVRTVIKRVFAKTGVDRQAALARLFARALPPLRRGD